MDEPIVTSARRQPRETISAQLRENRPVVLLGTAIGTALAVGLGGLAQSCLAQQQAGAAAAQATVAQSSQVKADVELDAAYAAISDKVRVLSEVAEELARSAQEQAERIEMLEEVVKAGLAGTAAGRKFQPAPETPAPDVQIDAVQEPLPPSPAAAAATTRRRP